MKILGESDCLRENEAYKKQYFDYKFRYICEYCLVLLDEEICTKDHIIPKSSGIKNIDSNLVSCCKYCNMIKGSLSVLQFLLLIKDKNKDKQWKKRNNLRYKFIEHKNKIYRIISIKENGLCVLKNDFEKIKIHSKYIKKEKTKKKKQC